MRKDDWKLIYFHDDRKLELYNLRRDIGEDTDLAKDEPRKLKELAHRLSDFLRESGGQMPLVKDTQKPVEYPDQQLRAIRSD